MNTLPVLCGLCTHIGVHCKAGAAQRVFFSMFHCALTSSCVIKHWFIRPRPWPPSLKRAFKIHQPTLRIVLQSVFAPSEAFVHMQTSHACRSQFPWEDEPFFTFSLFVQAFSQHVVLGFQWNLSCHTTVFNEFSN